jgi:hypothetical protein
MRQPYRRRAEPNRSLRLAAIEESIVALAQSQRIDAAFKRSMLDPLLVQWTSIDGRYGTRYRSLLALSEPSLPVEHDHVWTKRSLCRVLLSDLDERLVRQMIRTLIIGCVVLKAEHQRLTELDRNDESDHLTGWARYEEVGVDVIDMQTMTVATGPLRERPFDADTWTIVPPSFEDILDRRWPTDG